MYKRFFMHRQHANSGNVSECGMWLYCAVKYYYYKYVYVSVYAMVAHGAFTRLRRQHYNNNVNLIALRAVGICENCCK